MAVGVIVVAIVVGGSSVARAEPVSLQYRITVDATDVGGNAVGPVSFQYRTTFDATSVGGKALTPGRLIYTFDSDLAPGSGLLGSGPGFSSYGPLSQMFLEVGNRCVTVSGPGTAITVFDDSGNPLKDLYEVRADISLGATTSSRLFGLDLDFLQFLLIDTDTTMFATTALPLTPDFADLAERQQVVLRLIDPFTFETFFVTPDSGFAVSFHRPVESLEALLAEVDGLDVSASLKQNLTSRLQSALDVLTDASTSNDGDAASHLERFIQLVEAQAGKKIPAAIADQLIADALDVIDQLPPKGCS